MKIFLNGFINVFVLAQSQFRCVCNFFSSTLYTKFISDEAACLLFVGLRDRPPENDGRKKIKLRKNAKSGVIQKGSVL
jgi:hypothetical protein